MDNTAGSSTRSLPLYVPPREETVTASTRKPRWWQRVVGFKRRRRQSEDRRHAEQDLYVRTILESYCSSLSSGRFSSLPHMDSTERTSMQALRSACERFSIDENAYVAHPDTPNAHHRLRTSPSRAGGGGPLPVHDEHSEMQEVDVDAMLEEDQEEERTRRRQQRRLTHEALKAKLQERTRQRARTRRKLLIFLGIFALALTAFIVAAVIIANSALVKRAERVKQMIDAARNESMQEEDNQPMLPRPTVVPVRSIPPASPPAPFGSLEANSKEGSNEFEPTMVVPSLSPENIQGNPLAPKTGSDLTKSKAPSAQGDGDKFRYVPPPSAYVYVHCVLMSLSLWMSMVVIGMHLTFRSFRTYSLPFVLELSCVQCGYWLTALLRVNFGGPKMSSEVGFIFSIAECFFNFGQISFTCAIAFNMYRSVVSYADVLMDSHNSRKRYRSYTLNVLVLSLLAAVTMSLVGRKSMKERRSDEPCLYPTSRLIMYVYYPLLAFAFNFVFYIRFKRTIGDAYPVSATGRLNKVARSYLILFFVCWGSLILLTTMRSTDRQRVVPSTVKFILQSIYDVLGFGTAIITITNFQRCRKAFDFGLSLKAIDPSSIEFEEPLKILGEGTFALVLKAKWHQGVSDTSIPQTVEVAVKTFKHTQFETLEQMKEEAYLSSKLVHPCVMMTYGCYTQGNNLYIVSEYLGGGTLQDIIDSTTTLPYDTVLRYAHMIAVGMRFLHGLPVPIIHRDLKPLNCIFDCEQEMLKIADFGESRLFRTGKDISKKANFFPSADLTLQMTTNIGSACWAAPEVLKDESTSEYSLKIDVYSFGIICWQLYTCEVPYVDIPGSVLAVAEAVIDGHRPEIPCECPSLFAKIMRRCWHEDPLRRPSFEDIVQLLELEMDDERKKLTTVSSRRVRILGPMSSEED